MDYKINVPCAVAAGIAAFLAFTGKVPLPNFVARFLTGFPPVVKAALVGLLVYAAGCVLLYLVQTYGPKNL